MRRLLLLLLLFYFSLALRATDWPQFRGPNANGMSPETDMNSDWQKHPPRVLWKVPLTDDGYAGPAVAGGLVYIVDHLAGNDIVRALDVRSGKERWRFAYTEAGTMLYGFARATPAVAGGKVYTLSRMGLVHCLDARTGKPLWMRDIVKAFHGKRPQWYYAMSPLVEGDAVILCPGGRDTAVAALNRQTGATLWAGGGSDEPGYATPVAATINGVKQYVVFAGAALLGVEAAGGKLLWRFPWSTPLDAAVDSANARAHFNANAAVPLIIGNTVFITTGYGHGSALVEIAGGKTTARWVSKDLQSQYSSPVYADGYIYDTSDPRALVCLEANTGAVAWRQDGFSRGGGLAAVDGKLLVVDGVRGDVTLVRLAHDRYQALGHCTPLGSESRTAPIIADGKLFLRNRKALACVELR